MIGMFPGSFDPFTTEHKYIADIAAEMFDRLYIVVAINDDKTPMFSEDERKRIIENAMRDVPNVSICSSSKLMVDLAKELGVKRLVRGLRHTTEYEYEMKLATGNLLIGKIPTIGIFPRCLSISSSDVRLLIKHKNSAWENYVHPENVTYIHSILK